MSSYIIRRCKFYFMETCNEQKIYCNFSYHFANLTDLRQAHKIKHLLSEILFTAILATIAGADDFEDIAN